jgi:hypothetical protein
MSARLAEPGSQRAGCVNFPPGLLSGTLAVRVFLQAFHNLLGLLGIGCRAGAQPNSTKSSSPPGGKYPALWPMVYRVGPSGKRKVAQQLSQHDSRCPLFNEEHTVHEHDWAFSRSPLFLNPFFV